jgi:hypothetical protein
LEFVQRIFDMIEISEFCIMKLFDNFT